MDLFELAEKFMSMDECVWQRHANPWSGLSRIFTGSILFWAIWSYVWISWYSLIFVALLLFWLWLNPRIFPPVENDDWWITKGVFGEYLFLKRKVKPIPKHHKTAAYMLTVLSSCFLILSIPAFIFQVFWVAFFCFHLSWIFKLWFVDRMVWLYTDSR